MEAKTAGASKPVPGDEDEGEAAPEQRLTLDSGRRGTGSECSELLVIKAKSGRRTGTALRRNIKSTEIRQK